MIHIGLLSSARTPRFAVVSVALASLAVSGCANLGLGEAKVQGEIFGASADRERVIETNSRAVAMLPFGVGQIQNGDTGLGVAFALSEIITGGASIAFAGATSHYAAIDPNSRDANGHPVSLSSLNSALETTVLLNRVTFGAWATLAITGVLQAQIAFVSERTSVAPERLAKRTSLTVVPSFAFTKGAGELGLAGSF